MSKGHEKKVDWYEEAMAIEPGELIDAIKVMEITFWKKTFIRKGFDIDARDKVDIAPLFKGYLPCVPECYKDQVSYSDHAHTKSMPVFSKSRPA